MHAPSIVWIETDRGLASKNALEQFRQAGLPVVSCAPGKSVFFDADVRVLSIDSFDSDHEFRQEYHFDDRATLILVESTDQVLAVFDIAREKDDVGQFTEPVALLARRVSRLANRAIEMKRRGATENVDELTGLSNRRQFASELERQIEQLLPGENKALVMLDIDRFKAINDRYGHLIGDKIIRFVAQLVKRELSPNDMVARLGGEEFVCLISRYDDRSCIADAEKVLKRIADFDFASAMPYLSEPISISVSAGLTFLIPQSNPDEALKQADLAMYEAKNKGRNRLVTYEGLRQPAANSDEDLYLRHFENVTRVVNERVSNRIVQMGRRLVEAARRDANEDVTTKLKNRRYFDSRMSREIEISKKSGRPLTIALMDLDHFHGVNATFGWPTGDRVLREFADIAVSNIRQTDWLARYGGEEFCLVMTETDVQLGCKVAERIRSQVECCQIDSIDGRPVSFTVSIGVAQFSDKVKGVVDLVEMASTGLLEAKRLGRNRVVSVGEDGKAQAA